MTDFDLDAVKARQAEARAQALQELDDASTAHLTARAIAKCALCDTDGYRGSSVCDHIDHRAAADRGMALVREALAKGDR